MLVIDENKLKTLPLSLQRQVRKVAVSEISQEKKSVTPPLTLEEYAKLVKGAPVKSSQNKELSGFTDNYWWLYLIGGGALLLLFLGR